MAPRFLLNIMLSRPASLGCALVLACATALLASVDMPTTILVWAVTSVIALGVWRKTERLVLRAVGCRPLSARGTRTFSGGLDTGSPTKMLIVDLADHRLCTVSDRSSLVLACSMCSTNADSTGCSRIPARLEPATVAGELVVSIGMLPLHIGWYVNSLIGALGRLLALAIGMSLVVPLVIWPHGYLRWGGRLFGSMIGGMLG